ncbi:MAG: YbaB/EbfC family nucleoid-associated protein [candidate division KSB1 bacterium]|nr:YbaB/EbfC family nucleoid-associated protein [candidate division KSB1 bacterium]
MAKFNMGNLLKQAQQIQEQIQKIQEQLAEKRVEGTAGGGMVTAVANGKNEIVQIKIDPEVVDPKDIEMLEDLVVAAVNQALTRAQEMVSEEMSKVAGGLLPNMPSGFNLPGL